MKLRTRQELLVCAQRDIAVHASSSYRLMQCGTFSRKRLGLSALDMPGLPLNGVLQYACTVTASN